MTERDPGLDGFEALIGTWDTEATHPMVDAVVPGTVTYEWLEGGHVVVQRSPNEHELFPDAIGVIGAPEDGDGLVMEYFDSRGVRRTYRIAIDVVGLSYREAAHALRVREATITTRLHRARQRVARSLVPENAPENS